MVGGLIDIDVSDVFSIQPEIFYTRKGYQAFFEGPNESAYLDYIEIPILLRLNYHLNKFIPNLFRTYECSPA
jgi:hypothetical protein